MAQKRTIVGDSYKNALEQKRLDIFRREANKYEQKKRRKMASHRGESPEIIRRRIEQKKAEIRFYEDSLKKANSAASENLSTYVAVIMLIFFGILVLSGAILWLKHASFTATITLLVVALVFLSLSITAQMININRESNLATYQEKIKRLKKELIDLQNINLPPQK